MKQYTFESDYWQTGADLIRSSSGIINKSLGNQRPRLVVPPPAGRSASSPLVSGQPYGESGSDPLPIRFASCCNGQPGV